MENKSIGGALVDVFDAGVGLIKSEITAITRRLGNVAKVKGLGVVLLLAALIPLNLALIFLILFVFYGLMRLGLGAWAAALIMGLVSLLVTAALIFLGLRKLGAEVPDDSVPPAPLSDIASDDLKYGSASTKSSSAPAAPPEKVSTAAPSAAPVSTSPASAVSPSTVSSSTGSVSTAPVSTAGVSSEPGHTTGGHVVQSAPSPVDASRPGEPQSTSTQGKPTSEHASREKEQAGIPVSTHPTYSEDMKKEGY